MEYNNKILIPPVDLQQAVADLIESIAMENAALGRIIISEEKAIRAANDSEDPDTFVVLNESVNSLLKSITRFQMILQGELNDIQEILANTEDRDDDDEWEE